MCRPPRKPRDEFGICRAQHAAPSLPEQKSLVCYKESKYERLVQLTKENDIAIITINNPPVNALSPGVPEGISEAIDKSARTTPSKPQS